MGILPILFFFIPVIASSCTYGGGATANDSLGYYLNGVGLRNQVIVFHISLIYKLFLYSVGVIPYWRLNCSRKLAGACSARLHAPSTRIAQANMTEFLNMVSFLTCKYIISSAVLQSFIYKKHARIWGKPKCVQIRPGYTN